MGRLKVLFIPAWYPTKEQPVGGVSVREHAKAVRLYDDVVVLHCAGQSPDVKRLWRVEQETDESLTEGIPTYRVWHRRSPIPKTSSFIYLWSVLGAFRQIMTEGFRPDIIHTHVYAAGVPAVLIGKLYHLPVVITERSSAFPRRLLSTVEVLKARVAFQWSELVLPVSSALQRAIQDYGIRAQFRVVPNAVDTTIFFPRSYSNRGENPRRLLFVGRLVPVKGLPYLLQALTILHRRRDDWHLDIVGDGPERANYEQLVAQLGLADHIAFHGVKSKGEVAEFMRQADLFVLPSVMETMGCVLVEAMASGLPIVATAVGGIPEIVDEDSGFLTNAMDPNDMSETLEAALGNLKKFDREALAKKAFSKYSLQHVGRVLHELYTGVRHGQRFWNEHWRGLGDLPVEADESTATPYLREILHVFKACLPRQSGLTIVEVGGAPGGYLAYLVRTFGYKAHAIDNSDVGCRKLEKNFVMLGIPVIVYNRDILGDLSDLPRFDIVYSLGLIEHFEDPFLVVSRHVELAKPNGIVVLGVPSYLGINRVPMRVLKSDSLRRHNLKTMDLRTWTMFEQELGLKVIFKGYVGGWEPRMYLVPAKSLARRGINRLIVIIAKGLDKVQGLRRLNSRSWSGYAMAVYQKLAGV